MIVDQTRFKCVITFTSNKSRNQILNYLNNTVKTPFEAKINQVLTANFVSYSLEFKYKLIDLGGNTWQIYPKFSVSGETNLTQGQLITGISNLLAELKTILKTNFEANGATNVQFHIQYPDMRAKASDET